MEDLQQERTRLQEERLRLDAEWEKLRLAKAEFETTLSESSTEQKLFVGNLDENTTEEEVTALFEPFGNIKEVYMLKDKDGKSKRSSFVKMFTKPAAERAIEGISGKIKDKEQEKMIVVRFAAPKTDFRAQQQQQGNPYNAFGAMAAQGYGAANAYGYGGAAAAPYGAYGADPSYGAAAPAYGRAGGMGGGAGGGGGAGTGMGRGPSGGNLYINNVSATATEDEVRAMFSDFGTVLSTKLFATQGYGFVSYDNPQSASNAIHALNGLAIGNGQKRLEVTVKKDKVSRFSPY